MSATRWTASPERGSPWLLRLMARIALAAGRRVAHGLIAPIAFYFWCTAPGARRASRLYLARLRAHLARQSGAPPLPASALGPFASLAHLHVFATAILDRVYLLAGRAEALDVRLHGGEHLRRLADGGQGAFLVGAHLGSFEAVRALARDRPGLRVSMAMFEDNAQRIGHFLRSVDPQLDLDIVPLGRIDSMLTIQARLARGDFVGFLADRSLRDDDVQTVPFLGVPASFSTGVFRMAAALRRPVLSMAGLYLGGGRYDVHVEPLADFTAIERGRRAAAVREAVASYAARLETYCAVAPFNWFNFFDFWAGDARRPRPGRTPPRAGGQ